MPSRRSALVFVYVGDERGWCEWARVVPVPASCMNLATATVNISDTPELRSPENGWANFCMAHAEEWLHRVREAVAQS